MVAQLDSLYVSTSPRKTVVRLISHLLFQGRFVTTRHRWLNPLILSHLKLAARLPQLKEVEKPIFIVGTGRSGSTILGKVLSMHRHIAWLNEPKALWYTIDERHDVNGHFGRGPVQYRLLERDVTPDTREAAHRLFGYYLALTASRRIVDKNPEIIFQIPFAESIFPDAKFIFLVRDGWDTVRSIAAWSRRANKVVNGVRQDWWGADRRKWRLMVDELVSTEPLLADVRGEISELNYQEDMAAVEWIVTMQEGLRHQRARPESVYQLRYEDLTRCPDESLPKLLHFCSLPQDSVFLSYAQKVLEPNPTKEPVALSPSIRLAFDETMSALAYRTQTRT